MWITSWNVKNDDCATIISLDYLYPQNYYKIIGRDLARQTNTSTPHQINLVGKLKENNGAVMFFCCCCWKTAKDYSKLFFRFIKSTE